MSQELVERNRQSILIDGIETGLFVAVQTCRMKLHQILCVMSNHIQSIIAQKKITWFMYSFYTVVAEKLILNYPTFLDSEYDPALQHTVQNVNIDHTLNWFKHITVTS